MAVLFITSSHPGSGKTMLAAGIARSLVEDGRKVAYVRVTTRAGNVDKDAAFMKSLLGLEEPLENLVMPVGQAQNASTVWTGRDIVIEDEKLGAESARLAADLDVRVIGVEAYPVKLPVKEYQYLGKNLLGVVLNRVPASRVSSARQDAEAQLSAAGIKLLGVLPEDRQLAAISVGELAGQLHGKVWDGEKQLAELVENVMLGAMYVDSGIDYFSRKNNKAVVLRSERPDMQLAALETSTRCLVLVGKTEPSSLVIQRAKGKKVPIILTDGDVAAAVAGVEEALKQARFSQGRKMARLREILGQSLDLPAVLKELPA